MSDVCRGPSSSLQSYLNSLPVSCVSVNTLIIAHFFTNFIHVAPFMCGKIGGGVFKHHPGIEVKRVIRIIKRKIMQTGNFPPPLLYKDWNCHQQ